MNKAQLIDWAGRVPLLRGTLRWCAHRYAEGSVVTIQSGYAAGYRWRRHHRYVNGYWIGQFELQVQHALHALLRPGANFFDVGANAGFFTLVAAGRVGPSGQCVAFDPLPENQSSIREQITLNRLEHCRVVRAAVGGQVGRATMVVDAPGSPRAHVGVASRGERAITAPMTTLDEASRRFGPPDLIKMDIEGGELDALHGATTLLRKTKPIWLIELHGQRWEQGVRSVLTEAGYRFLDLHGRPWKASGRRNRHVVAMNQQALPILPLCDRERFCRSDSSSPSRSAALW